jgi:putative addiction module component (TIGR02574 family)
MDSVLLKKALEMPPKARVVLAELILASIDNEDKEIQKSWLKEANSRLSAIEKGTAKTINFDELMNES